GDAGQPAVGNTVQGSVGGLTLTPKDAAAVTRPRGAFAPDAWVAVADAPPLCTLDSKKAGSTILYFNLMDGTSQDNLTPGVYRQYAKIPQSELLTSRAYIIDFEREDTNCGPGQLYSSLDGTVTVEKVTADTITGSFDLSFDQGALKGHFSATI